MKCLYLHRKLFSLVLSATLLLALIPFCEINANAASNEETIYNFLVNNIGFNTAAACGVLANIEKESGFRNDVTEYGYTWSSGGGYGICQWTNSPRTSSSGRRTNLVNWCSNNGYDYTSLVGQLNYLKYELNTSYYYNLVTSRLFNVSNNADGAYWAGYYWCYFFEVPAGYNTGVSVNRGNYAKNTYWPAYSGEPTSQVTELTLSNYNYPTNLSVGEAFYFTGTISAPVALEWAYIGIMDVNGNPVRSKGIDPGTTSVDIATQLDSYISMSTLSAGKYYYHVEATDCNHNFKVLHQSWFNVGAVSPGSTTPSVSPGTSSTNTTFSWNATSNTSSYDLRIYSGTTASDENQYDAVYGITGTSYSYPLPSGTYVATLASVNGTYYDCWTIGSTTSAFSVSSPATYAVSYNANGGIGAPGDQTKTQGTTLVLSGTKPTRVGYTFKNWNTNADGSGAAYNPDAAYNTDAPLALFAQWTAGTYTVVYNGNGSTSGTMAASSHVYDTAKALTANAFAKTGYIFAGWNTKSDGMGSAYADKASVKNLTPTNGAAVTLYAQWTEITLTNIDVKTMPDKISYIVGDTLNTAGLTLTATYSDNSELTISSGFTCSPTTLNSIGTQKITVTYSGKICEFNVTVVDDIPSPDAPQFIVSNARGVAGSTVEITVDVRNNPGIIAAKLNVSYDKTKLKLVSATNGGIMGTSIFDPGNTLTDVPYSVCWNDMGTTNYSANGTMVTYKFEVLDGAALGKTPITLTYDSGSTFNSDLTEVRFAVVNGMVEITDRMPGDANGDNSVDLKDVVVIRRYLAGGWNVTLDMSSADVNGDGSVDLKDVVLIRRYLAGGWGIVLK